MRAVYWSLLLLFGIGCASASEEFLKEERAVTETYPEIELTEVPFIAQEDGQCGAAALAMVLAFYGTPTDIAELAPLLSTPGREGALQLEMVSAARRLGYLAYVAEPRLESLLAELRAGHPVIVLQNLGLSIFPVWHYSIVIGVNHDGREIIVRSGLKDKERYSVSLFSRTWKRGDNWALVVVPSDIVPATADRTSFLREVNLLEQAGKLESALIGYETALTRWSVDEMSFLGAGNTLYRLNRKIEAKQFLEKGVENFPQSGPLLNNLAHLLNELGQLSRSRQLLGQCLEQSINYREACQRTLDQIKYSQRNLGGIGALEQH